MKYVELYTTKENNLLTFFISFGGKKETNPILMNTDTSSTVPFINHINRNNLFEEDEYYGDSLLQNFGFYKLLYGILR